MQQRLALFDLDGTLVDRQTAVRDALTALCRAYDFDVATEQWLRHELADRANPDNFVRLRREFSLAVPAGQLWREYVDLMAAAVTCRPEVLDGLACLRAAAWTIGIVTNGASDVQRAKIAATGLAHLIDGVAVSGDLEIRKPDQRLYELAASRCGRNLTEGGWMTGDNPAGDIGGGHQAGLTTIWLRGRPWPDGVEAAHYTVDDVTDAINIMLSDTSE
ncbi:HAD family hydrolase (plasmid) [Streptomyces poriferorum]|uniref:HAD family hydrolase n=1 Tax=Streptomyces poriferorum TaxID=2798799 RepID=UPI00273FF202|nr:HAD family hydrolase [Streptomyces sp. Alt1]WLQ53788.1 HAD family hydrolase [Streptomyces sp. Alt1]